MYKREIQYLNTNKYVTKQIQYVIIYIYYHLGSIKITVVDIINMKYHARGFLVEFDFIIIWDIIKAWLSCAV